MSGIALTVAKEAFLPDKLRAFGKTCAVYSKSDVDTVGCSYLSAIADILGPMLLGKAVDEAVPKMKGIGSM